MNEVLKFGGAAFAWVLQTSWQAGVLALVILLTQTLCRDRLPPAWRYGLWLLLVVRLLLPSSPRVPWSVHNIARWPETFEAVGALPEFQVVDNSAASPEPVVQTQTRATLVRPPANTATEPPPNAHPRYLSTAISWRRLAFLLWALGVIAIVLRLILSNVRFQWLLKRDAAIINDSTVQLLKMCQETLGVRQRVILLESSAVQSPSVQGLWRKRLLMPKGACANLSSEELRCVFLHELAHLKRHDLEVSWLTSLLLAVHWFNPLLWFAFAKMRVDRELACDALALANLGPDRAQSYGETIIKLVENLQDRPSLPGVLTLSEDKRQLKDRIRMIAHFKQWPRWSVLTLGLSFGIAAFGLTNASQDTTLSSPKQSASNQSLSQNDKGRVLPRGIHCRVVDVKGNPVTGALVDCQGFNWQGTTDTRGGFSWTGQEQPRRFLIKKDGYKDLYTETLSPSEQETTLILQRPQKISGKVIDKESRQPVASFRVYNARVLQGPIIPWLSSRSRDSVAGKSGTFEYSFNDYFSVDNAFYIEADGYVPALSRPLIQADDGTEFTFELAPTPPVVGVVITPEGSPAEKAEIYLWCGELNISDIPDRRRFKSGKGGDFTVPVILDGKVLVSHNSGYAEVTWQDFLATKTVQLAAWGHVRGFWPKPLPKDRSVGLERINWSGGNNLFMRPPPWRISSTQVRSDGSFEFEDGVPPGEYMVSEIIPLLVSLPGGGSTMPLLTSLRASVLVEAGRTAIAEMPTGRTITGKLDSSDGQSLTSVHLPTIILRLKQDGPESKFPRTDQSLSDAQNFERLKQYRQQVLQYSLSEVAKVQRRAERRYETTAQANGSFQIDNVPPGTYDLSINGLKWSGKPGTEIQKVISVTASTDESPIDLGIQK